MEHVYLLEVVEFKREEIGNIASLAAPSSECRHGRQRGRKWPFDLEGKPGDL